MSQGTRSNATRRLLLGNTFICPLLDSTILEPAEPDTVVIRWLVPQVCGRFGLKGACRPRQASPLSTGKAAVDSNGTWYMKRRCVGLALPALGCDQHSRDRAMSFGWRPSGRR